MSEVDPYGQYRERCQHCPNLADERSFMCEDCAAQADEEVQTLRDQLRGAVSDRGHYRAALERIESHGSGEAVRIAREALASPPSGGR